MVKGLMRAGRITQVFEISLGALEIAEAKFICIYFMLWPALSSRILLILYRA